MVHLSWKPRIFLYKKFLSDAECDHLMTKGAAGMAASEVGHWHMAQFCVSAHRDDVAGDVAELH